MPQTIFFFLFRRKKVPLKTIPKTEKKRSEKSKEAALKIKTKELAEFLWEE